MSPKIVLVTGGNRGIGFGIVQALAQRSEENTIVIASRKKSDAEEAIVGRRSWDTAILSTRWRWMSLPMRVSRHLSRKSKGSSRGWMVRFIV